MSTILRGNDPLQFACIALLLAGSAHSQRVQATGAVVLSARLEAISVSAIPRKEQDLTVPFQSGSTANPFLIRTLLAIPSSLTTVRIFAYLADGVSALRAGDHGETSIPAGAVHIWFSKDDTDIPDQPMRSDWQAAGIPSASEAAPVGNPMEQTANILNVQIDPHHLPKIPARGFTGTLSLLVQAL